jgi:hypothetical protein
MKHPPHALWPALAAVAGLAARVALIVLYLAVLWRLRPRAY